MVEDLQTFLHLPFIGVVLYVAVSQLWTQEEERGLSRLLGLSIAGTGLFLVGRYLQRVGTTHDEVRLALQLQYASFMLVAGFGFAAARVRVKRPLSLADGTLLAVVVAALIGTVFASGFASGELEVREGPFDRIAWIRPGPLSWPLYGFGLVIASMIIRDIRDRSGGERVPAVRYTVALLVVAMVHDIGMSLGLYTTTHLAHFAILVLVLVVGSVRLQRLNRLRRDLGSAVEERTEELARSERRFRRLADASFEAILLVRNGHVADADDKALRMFGEDLLDSPVGRILGDDYVLRAPVQRAAMKACSVDGLIPVELSARELEDDCTVLAIRDMRERKAMERRVTQSSRLASLGELAAGTAHEINNLLAVVTLNLELLKQLRDEGDLDEDTLEELVAESHDASLRVSGIVEDMRSFGKRRSPTTPVVANDVVVTALRLAHGELRRHARVIQELDATRRITVDEGRLIQVLVNLLINAAHARDASKSEHSIRVRTTDVDGAVRITVTDSGTGIAPELRDRIFEPFFTTKDEGTGLGLAISREIIERFGGRMELTSEVGKGTTFEVLLPAVRAERVDAPRDVKKSGHRRKGALWDEDDDSVVVG